MIDPKIRERLRAAQQSAAAAPAPPRDLRPGNTYALPSWHAQPLSWVLVSLEEPLQLVAADEFHELRPQDLKADMLRGGELSLRGDCEILLPRDKLPLDHAVDAVVEPQPEVLPQALADALAERGREAHETQPPADAAAAQILSPEFEDWIQELPRIQRWTQSYWSHGQVDVHLDDFEVEDRAASGFAEEGRSAPQEAAPEALPLAAADGSPEAALLAFRAPPPPPRHLELPLLPGGRFFLVLLPAGHDFELRALAQDCSAPSLLPQLQEEDRAPLTWEKGRAQGEWQSGCGISLPGRRATQLRILLPEEGRELALQLTLV
jgi:hypothetical protein